MIPRKLALRNFMCYRADVPPLEFDGISIACLSGENGAGKSALLDALTWALWGESRLRSDDDLIALGEQEMMVDLTFALDGQDYRVTRKRSKGKRGGLSQLEFQMRHNGSWKVLNPGLNLRETQQAIDGTLRMGYETFSNSAFLRQNRADEFTRKEPSKRKQVLADILGLSVYEELESGSKTRVKELDGAMKGIDGQIEAYLVQAEKRELYSQLAAEAERVAELRGAELLQAQAAFDRATERVQLIESRKPLREERRRQAERLQEQRTTLERKLETSNRHLSAARQMLERAGEIRAGAAQFLQAQADLNRLEGLRDSYDSLQKQRLQQEQALREARMRLETELSRVEGELRGLRERSARRPKLEQEIRELAARLDLLAPIAGELDATRRTRADVLERSRLANKLHIQRLELQKNIEQRRDSLIATREELKRRVRDASEQLKDEARWRIELDQARHERERFEADRERLEQVRQEEAQASEQIGALRTACDTIKSQGDTINEKLALLKSETGTCPLCGSPLGADGAAHIEAEYQRERTVLRDRFKETKREADTLAAHLKTLQANSAALRQAASGLTEVAGRIARLERDLHAAEEAHRRQSEDQRKLEDVQVQIVKGDYEHSLRAEMSRVEGEIAGLGTPEHLDREMTRLERRERELEKQLQEQAQLQSQIQSRRDQIRQIDDDDPALHEHELREQELKTTLEMQDFGQEERLALKRVDSELDALGYAPEQHSAARARVTELVQWEKEERRLENAEEWITQNEPQIIADEEALRRYESEAAEVAEQLQALDDELRALEPAMRARSEAQVKLREATGAKSSAERDLTEKNTLLNQAEEASARLLEREAERKKLTERRGLFEELTQAFGKKGVQALLIETAIPEIEREANTLLAGMTDNQMHLTFETQGSTKKGDPTETLDIKIADTLGTRDYDAYSGGESFRVDFAIRVALAKLLARRAGARLETLVIDEGFGSQDARGRERLVEAITSIQRDFKQILVVTHIQELKDMFPVQIEIVKTPDGSRWAVA